MAVNEQYVPSTAFTFSPSVLVIDVPWEYLSPDHIKLYHVVDGEMSPALESSFEVYGNQIHLHPDSFEEGENFYVRREVPLVQPYDSTGIRDIKPKEFERAMDRIIMAAQELQNRELFNVVTQKTTSLGYVAGTQGWLLGEDGAADITGHFHGSVNITSGTIDGRSVEIAGVTSHRQTMAGFVDVDLGTTDQPDIARLGATPAGRYVTISAGITKLYGGVNIYQFQISKDGLTWFGLPDAPARDMPDSWKDGSGAGWTETTETTIQLGPMPFDEVEGEPVATTYYFRARGVRVDGEVSGWSLPVTAVMELTGNSDLAYNSIEATRLALGTIGSAQLTAELNAAIGGESGVVTQITDNMYALKLNANGQVSGFGLISELLEDPPGGTSTFKVSADTFQVSSPGADYTAFTITTLPDEVDPTLMFNGKMYATSLVANWIEAGEIRSASLSVDVISDVMSIFSEDIVIGGQIRSSNYDSSGDPIDPDVAGFFLGAGGKFKARNASLVGVLKTGSGAADDARVAIKDQYGILSGPNHVGGGINDLEIVSEGGVAGDWDIEVVGTETETVRVEQNNARAVRRRIEIIGSHDSIQCTPLRAYNIRKWEDYLNSPGVYSDTLLMPVIYPAYNPVCRDTMIYTVVDVDFTLDMAANYALGTVFFEDRYFENMDYRYQLDYPNGSWSGYSQIPPILSVEIPNTAGQVTATWTSNGAKDGANEGDFVDYTYQVDTIRWRKDGGAWSSPVRIPVNKQLEITGADVTVAFSVRHGHTAGDMWSFTQGSMRGLSIRDSSGVEYLSVAAGAITASGVISAEGGLIFPNSETLRANNSSGVSETFLWPRWSDDRMYLNYGTGGFRIRTNGSATTMEMYNDQTIHIPVSIGVGVAPNSSYAVYAKGGTYGVWGEGSTMGGRFVDTGGTSTTYCAYGSWGIYTGQNAYFGGSMGIGGTSMSYKLHVYGDIYANGGWLRVSGSAGVYFQSYGGGWNMSDTTYIRSYGSKSVLATGIYSNGIVGTASYYTTQSRMIQSVGSSTSAPSSSNLSIVVSNYTGTYHRGTNLMVRHTYSSNSTPVERWSPIGNILTNVPW